MKAPRPLHSPSAQTPGTFVARRSSTGITPRLSVATPAASSPRSSVFGRRPIASSTWLPISWGAPASQLTRTATSAPWGAKLMHSAPVRIWTPSASRIARIASETSASSRPISRGPFSITVTSAPSLR